MKIILSIIATLFLLSVVIQLFEKSFLLGIVVTIAAVLFLFLSIKKEQEKLSNLSPEELNQKALKEYKEKESYQIIKQDIERDKKIRDLKSKIKLKLGIDVNLEKNEIEINGILFKIENRPDRWLSVLVGKIYCKDCGFTERIIDDISDYGYLIQKYEEHLDKCIRKD